MIIGTSLQHTEAFGEIPSIEELRKMCSGNFLWESEEMGVLLDVCDIDEEYGEYSSPGNLWVEVTHSAEDPPIWNVWSWSYYKEFHTDVLIENLSELELTQKFYKQYDISILDLVKSDKNAEICEAIGCNFGTYHLLVSEIDWEKFQDTNFDFQIISDTHVFITNQVKYHIPYLIENAIVKEIAMNCNEWSLVIEIIPNGEGKLEIYVSTDLMDPLAVVLLDHEEARKAEATGNTITVWFAPDSKRIEIIGGSVLTPASGTCKLIHNPPYSYILPPLKQMKNGVDPTDVICKENLGLVFKSTDLSTSCVKPESVQKLIERGWAKS